MVELTYYDAWYKGSLDLHKNLGMLLLVCLMFRVGWRVINIQPTALAGPAWQQWVGHWMHQSLYMVMLLLMVSGYLISTAAHALAALKHHFINKDRTLERMLKIDNT